MDVKLDFESIRAMPCGLVPDDVPAGDEEQAAVALEEKPGGVGQRPLALEGYDSRHGDQQSLDQDADLRNRAYVSERTRSRCRSVLAVNFIAFLASQDRYWQNSPEAGCGSPNTAPGMKMNDAARPKGSGVSPFIGDSKNRQSRVS
jgi:hypothetical protein